MFEFSLALFNQHSFENTNFKQIDIAKDRNLIIAQKAITQECTKKKLGAELSLIDKHIASTDAGLAETILFVFPFCRKEVLTINLFWSLGSWMINKFPIRSAFKFSLP